MTTFSKLTLDAKGNPVETDIREINQSDMMKCPHFIMTPEHYRSDGTCRCDDITHTEMAKWGYQWNSIRRQWR
jgi:hypothetical protein